LVVLDLHQRGVHEFAAERFPRVRIEFAHGQRQLFEHIAAEQAERSASRPERSSAGAT
jgi:hypothetical protein